MSLARLRIRKEQSPGNWVPLPCPILQPCFQKNLWYPCLTSLRGLQLAVAGQMILQHLIGQRSQTDRKACWAWTPQDAGSGSLRTFVLPPVGLALGQCLQEGPLGASQLCSAPFILPSLDCTASFPPASGGWPHRTPAPVPDSLPLKITY